MTIFRRLTSVVLTVAMAFASIGAGAPACASHASSIDTTTAEHGGMVMPGMSMDDMSMPGMSQGNGDADCDECAPPADPTPPCDHQSMAGECATMVSCVSVVAETQPRLPDALAASGEHARAAPPNAPSSIAFTPDTPPPRA